MHWQPEPLWEGLDAFIIGGGHSLREFDFDLLKHEHVIGCNNAYQFGPEICNICIFGDRTWLDHHKNRLQNYVDKGGFVVTNDTHLANTGLPWLHWTRRRVRGLHLDALGWNRNTGASAINLGLLLGAVNVYLLGFDRTIDKVKGPNWHTEILDKPDANVHRRMSIADAYMKRDLKSKFPGRQVWNVTDASDLNVWPKISTETFWSERKQNEGSKIGSHDDCTVCGGV